MPVTPMNAPDGTLIKVNHPEGATKTEIGHAAQVIWVQRLQKEQARQGRIQDLILSNPAEFDPSSEAFQDRFGPTGSFGQNLLAGSGKAFTDLGRGAVQLGVEGANLIPGVNLDETAANIRSNITDVRERDAPLLSTGGGLTGNIGTNIGLALLPGGAASGVGRGANVARAFSNPQTFRAAAGAGAALGALNPVGEGESRIANIGLGAGGGVAGKAIAQPIINQLSRGGAAARELLEAEGVPLNLAQRTGSARAQTISGMLDDSLLTANAQASFKDTQLKAFTRAVLRTIGAESDEATPTVMLSAKNKIGSVFNSISNKTNGIRADGELFQSAGDVFRQAQVGLLDDEFRLFERNFRNVFNSIDNGRINARQFNSALSKLGKLSTRPNIGSFARSLEDTLLDALGRSSPDDIARLGTARAQWRNLRTIQGAVGKGEDRFISPLRLSSTLANKSNQNLSVFGQGRAENVELSNLARAGRELLPSFADSGTARRTQVPLMASVLAGAGAGTAAGGPVGGLIGAGAALTAPSILQKAIGSQGLLGMLLEQGLPGLLQPVVKQGAIQASQKVQ